MAQSRISSDAWPLSELNVQQSKHVQQRTSTGNNIPILQNEVEYPKSSQSRRREGQLGGTADNHGVTPSTDQSKAEQQEELDEKVATETIFKLERLGEGWGEEILPRLTVERRVIEPKSKLRRKNEAEVEKSGDTLLIKNDKKDENKVCSGSFETFLAQVGVPPAHIQSTIEKATAWRFTAKGRALIDKRRTSRVERNAKVVTEHLMSCGIPLGPSGVGAILASVPLLMLCKPTTNDRWDRRAVELAAFAHTYGHCNVPEGWEETTELGVWVKRQRIARAAGALIPDRLAVLEQMGFDFGQTAQVTEEWEHRFDQLIDWILWHKENSQVFTWLALDWGERGGSTARELAIWMTLQQEYHRRNVLSREAIQRLEALDVVWEPHGTGNDVKWMKWLGCLIYVVERKLWETRSAVEVKGQSKRGRPKSNTVSSVPFTLASGTYDEGDETALDGDEDAQRPNVMAARLANETVARREALARCDLRQIPGLRFWISRQRRSWRMQVLGSEKSLMLGLAGVDLDGYTPLEWQSIAHTTANLINGSDIFLAGKSTKKETCQMKLKVLRWVQTQQALFAEGRLSKAQLRYMSFLGIIWVLSEEVIRMDDKMWNLKRIELESFFIGKRETTSMPTSLHEWLSHQRGLYALGLLQRDRVAALKSLNVSFQHSRTKADSVWDHNLGELLAYRAKHGNLSFSKDDDDNKSIFDWLLDMEGMYQKGRLPEGRAMQLRALGYKFH